jgi:hypothetical protein
MLASQAFAIIRQVEAGKAKAGLPLFRQLKRANPSHRQFSKVTIGNLSAQHSDDTS